MTVQQLIDLLQAFPKDLIVVVDGYEGGVNEASYASDMYVHLNANDEWYYGAHEPTFEGDGAHVVHIG